MRSDRLLKLAQLLEDDANNPKGVMFDLDGWAKPVEIQWCEDAYHPNTTTVPMNCGTNACALGLGAISGIFADEGFGFHVTDRGTLYPTFEGFTAFRAAEEFFELPFTTRTSLSYQLFDPVSYPANLRKGKQAELEVAKRIRELVANGMIYYNYRD